MIGAPIARRFTLADAEAVEKFMSRGGSVLLLSSGGRPDRFGERAMFLYLGLGGTSQRLREAPPSWWPTWRRWKMATRRLEPADSGPLAGQVGGEALAGWFGVARPPRARVWLVDDEGSPMAFEIPQARGRLLVVNDATMWANGWIGNRGNARLLRATVEELLPPGEAVIFDEWHQGALDVEAAGSGAWVTPFELLVAHVLLVYLLAAWTLSRRFGPKLAPSRRRGEQGANVLGALSDLHVRAGHHREAAGRLVELARRRLARRGRDPSLVPDRDVTSGKELVSLAREIGKLQREREV